MRSFQQCNIRPFPTFKYLKILALHLAHFITIISIYVFISDWTTLKPVLHSGFLKTVQKVCSWLFRLAFLSGFDKPFEDAKGIKINKLLSQTRADAELEQISLNSLSSCPIALLLLCLHLLP